jgi:23S rRNA (uracil1939-C5)-methyltransferase
MQRRSAFKPSRKSPSPSETRPHSAPIDVKIEKLVYGGEGLAHHQDSAIFVPYVLPGERVAAVPWEQKKKFIRARLKQVLEPSPQRTTPACPHFATCGGCDYQHIPYESQLVYKVEILRETLRRLGKIEWPGEIKTHASEAWRYRNRAQWKIRPLGSGDADAAASTTPATTALGIGYFRANSTQLCAVHDCPILAPVLLKTLMSLREAIAAGVLPRELREIEAFTPESPDGADARVLLTATFAGFPSRAPEHAAKFREIVPEIESLLFHDPGRDRMELFGPGFIESAVGENRYRVGHFSFFQVNRFLIAELANAVTDAQPGGELALDLFAGVGLFTAPLAKRFQRVIAVESNPAAVRDLEANARAGSIEIRTADVEQFLQKFKGTPDLVVLDPPRAGLPPGAAQRLAQIGANRITYVSCEPPTLARDLAVLCGAGYELAELHLFDLFPQTFHMETVARLSRTR